MGIQMRTVKLRRLVSEGGGRCAQQQEADEQSGGPHVRLRAACGGGRGPLLEFAQGGTALPYAAA